MRSALAITLKDLRIEQRSKVVLSQVVPFALIVLILFGIALDADRATLRAFTPGLFWVTVLFAAILTTQRSLAVEAESEAFEGLRLSGAPGWAVFVGKTGAVFVQLLVIEALMLAGVVVLYQSTFSSVVLIVTSALVATAAIAAAASLYGVLAVGMGVRDTILPLLLLPVLTPVLVAATRSFDEGFGTAAVNGWAWTGMLAIFAAVYLLLGGVAYGVVLEDA